MNKLFISLIIAAVVVLGLLMFQALQGGTSIVLLPSDLATSDAKTARPRVRVAGRVTTENVQYTVEPKFELRFSIENPGEYGTSKTVPVVYMGIKPDMFASGRDVIIDGDFKEGVLVANKLLTQCPSKYEPPKPDEKYTLPSVAP